MNEIILRNPPTAGSVATDLLESVIVILMIWRVGPNRLIFLLALCAAAALLLYRIRRYDYSIVITPTCVRRQRRYGKAEVIPLCDYEGVGVGAIQQTGYRPGHLVQTALIRATNSRRRKSCLKHPAASPARRCATKPPNSSHNRLPRSPA